MTPEPENRLVQSASGPPDATLAPPLQRSDTPFPPKVPIIPDHELLKKIGHGSYGDVWLARTVLGEYRAVKVVYRRDFGDNRPFEREFEGIQRYEPVSRSHPSQVQILHVGINQAGGYFYYVMELADDAREKPNDEIQDSKGAQTGNSDGRATIPPLQPLGFRIPSELEVENPELYLPHTLRQELERRGRLPLDDCVELGLRLTTALEHLHQHGLVHRDVKPSNIIFVRGTPKLADIGLVTEAGDGKSIVGTEGYLAPEGPGSASADLYSLGKVLYELSTGRDRRDFPDLPRDLENWPERRAFLELNEVLLKSCANDSRQRYPSAEEMMSDLKMLQRGKSVGRKHAAPRRVLIAKKYVPAAGVFAVLASSIWLFSPSWRAGETEALRVQKNLTTNLDALNAYAQGRYAYNKNTDLEMTNAIRYFERAIALDPNFAEAYAGLASSFHWLEFPRNLPKARAPAEKAVKLNPKLPEAHKQLAILKYMLDWRWAEAEDEFKLAIKLNPADGETLRAYGYYLKCMGRTNEAIAMATRAHELDPRSIGNTRVLGDVFLAAGDYARAIKQYQAIVDLEPNDPVAREYLAQAYEAQGLFAKAIDMQQEESVLLGEDPTKAAEWCDALRGGYRKDGPSGYWRKSLEWAKGDPDYGPADGPYDIAKLYARLGDKESAFKYLKNAFQERDVHLVLGIKTDRAFDKFRGEREYSDLLKNMKWE